MCPQLAIPQKTRTNLRVTTLPPANTSVQHGFRFHTHILLVSFELSGVHSGLFGTALQKPPKTVRCLDP